MVELGNLRKNRNIKIMCGRYVLFSKEKFKNKYNINISPNYNISPNQEVFVIDQNMNITKLKWGIRAEWKNSLIINARSETIDVKKSFVSLNRCVFISDGYYEWKRIGKFKTPYYHYVPNRFLYFAGLCNNIGCVVVTMDSFQYLAKVHRRQPFFLKENQIDSWIKNEKSNIIFDEVVNFHKVSTEVNKIWCNSNDLISEVHDKPQ